MGRIKMALGNRDLSESDRAALEAGMATRSSDLRPALGADTVAHFKAKIESNLITVRTIADLRDVPAMVAAIARENNLSPDISVSPSLNQLGWPATVAVRTGKARLDEKICVTRAVAGIAETGTVVLCSGDDAPSSLNFAPEVHVIVLDQSAINRHLEDGLRMVRAHYPVWPRAVNLVSGPSRTADVGGIVVRPAHGPKLVYLLIVAQA